MLQLLNEAWERELLVINIVPMSWIEAPRRSFESQIIVVKPPDLFKLLYRNEAPIELNLQSLRFILRIGQTAPKIADTD